MNKKKDQSLYMGDMALLSAASGQNLLTLLLSG